MQLTCNCTATAKTVKTMVSFFQHVFGFEEEGKYHLTSMRLNDTAIALFKPAGGDVLNPNRHYWQDSCGFGLPPTTIPDAQRFVEAGKFSHPSVAQLQSQVQSQVQELLAKKERDHEFDSIQHVQSTITVRHMTGDIRRMHSAPFDPKSEYSQDFPPENYYIFQVASKFNLLQPRGQSSPFEPKAITLYDHPTATTQGQACAIACAAGTAYRHHVVPVMTEDGEMPRGQTPTYQLNGLKGIEDYLSTYAALPSKSLPWTMCNGRFTPIPNALKTLNNLLKSDPDLHDELLSRLQIGVQEDTFVTDRPIAADWNPFADGYPLVTQTFNSAISIQHQPRGVNADSLSPMAKIVLQATYEATLLVAISKALQFALNGIPTTVTVLLTKVGGGIDRKRKTDWICDAIQRAIGKVEELVTTPCGIGLDIRIVHHDQEKIDDAFKSLGQPVGLL